MVDLDGLSVSAVVAVAASPEAVWDVVTDVARVGEWSPECREVRWAGNGPGAAAVRPGARFVGHNRNEYAQWSVTCVVVGANRPRHFSWAVLNGEPGDVSRPSSTWRYDLEPLGGGTLVRHTFIHGPGGSGVVEAVEARPQAAQVIIEHRLATLRHNMEAVLAGVKAAAESAESVRSG
jgi:uncharacterized protein YndB with AHSA1/START domain